MRVRRAEGCKFEKRVCNEKAGKSDRKFLRRRAEGKKKVCRRHRKNTKNGQVYFSFHSFFLTNRLYIRYSFCFSFVALFTRSLASRAIFPFLRHVSEEEKKCGIDGVVFAISLGTCTENSDRARMSVFVYVDIFIYLKKCGTRGRGRRLFGVPSPSGHREGQGADNTNTPASIESKK